VLRILQAAVVAPAGCLRLHSHNFQLWNDSIDRVIALHGGTGATAGPAGLREILIEELRLHA
jgi:hypothetical protein